MAARCEPLSYSEVAKKENIVEKKNEKTDESNWTIINKYTKEVKISKSTIRLREVLLKKKNERLLNNMINNWNNYRDLINKEYGDRSPYLNYKNEINKLVKETNKIMEMLEDIEKESYNSESEEEFNN